MLRINQVSFSYPRGQELLRDYSVELPSKGIIHLRGSNGSGKTTFLKIVAGLILPQQGSLVFNESILTSDQCSYMPAQPESLFLHLTGEENLRLFCSLNHDQVVFKELVEMLKHLQGFQKALTTRMMFCSTGMKQIINFARVLTKQCSLLLLDEPFKGLDDESRKSISHLIQDLSAENLILVTGHHELELTISQEIQFPLFGQQGGLSHV
jgi:ABC-type multidrug transport system ATPase subunit